MAIITKRQGQYEIQEDVEVSGDVKSITGNLTVGHGKIPNGSFSLKVTSSLLSDQPSDKKAVLDAFAAAAEEAYDSLFDKIEAVRKGREEANGQLTITSQIDALKAEANADGEPAPKDEDKQPAKPKNKARKTAAAKPTDESTPSKPKSVSRRGKLKAAATKDKVADEV